MTIIVFLIDTSASMAMKTYLGTTYLDFARKIVEDFMKQFQQRQIRDLTNRDRYMLMTFGDYPQCVKVGWKEGVKVFEEQLKNLKADCITSFGPAIGATLRFVCLNRLLTGLENYGFGRNPTYTDPVTIVVITDGNSLNDIKDGVVNDIRFSKPTLPGFELTEEPFRWDQRLFSIVLRFPGNAPPKLTAPFFIPLDESRIEDMCVVTGGRSYTLTHHKQLSACVEMIVQKIQMNGVLIKLEKYGPDPPPVPNDGTEIEPEKPKRIQDSENKWDQEQLVMILHRNRSIPGNSTAFWPIPEAFWPDENMPALPPRKAHPKVVFKCEEVAPIINTDFPFDKYELDYCPLVQYILDRKQPNLCWQVFVLNSCKPNSTTMDVLGSPFGYLKVSSNMQKVTLVILPYNYPELMSILEDCKDERIRSSAIWTNRLERYLANIPSYYIPALKRQLRRFSISHPILDDTSSEQIYSAQVVSYINKMKDVGKREYAKACDKTGKAIQESLNPDPDRNGILVSAASKNKEAIAIKSGYQSTSVIEAISNMPRLLEEKLLEYRIMTNSNVRSVSSAPFFNSFDIKRSDLLEQLSKMSMNLDMHLKNNRLQFLEGGKPGTRIGLQHAEELHSQPISRMGDYQLYAQLALNAGMGPLRELEPQMAKAHAFGNPFKLDKKSMSIVDEVGELNSSLPTNYSKNLNDKQEKQQVTRTLKRKKPGPLNRSTIDEWKRRRRSRSTDSDMSDTSLLSSDISDIMNLEDDSTPFDPDSPNIYMTPPRSPNQDPFNGHFDNGDKFSLTSKKHAGRRKSVNVKVLASVSSESMDDEIIELPAKRARLSVPQTEDSVKNPFEESRRFEDTRNELKRMVRRKGRRIRLYRDCLEMVKEFPDADKEKLLYHTISEAKRFKVNDLVLALTHEANRLKEMRIKEEMVRNSSDLLSDILD